MAMIIADGTIPTTETGRKRWTQQDMDFLETSVAARRLHVFRQPENGEWKDTPESSETDTVFPLCVPETRPLLLLRSCPDRIRL